MTGGIGGSAFLRGAAPDARLVRMMQLNRKALFEHLAAEENDKSLKAYRALAKELKIYLHVGSLALKFSPEKAVNRSFLIAPDGGLLACYDKIHMVIPSSGTSSPTT